LKKFIGKWKSKAIYGPYIEGVRVCFDVKRKKREIKAFLNELLKNLFDQYAIR